jgi:hypothetical protein
LNDKDQPEKKTSDEEAKDDLKADRDDSMGYSREQFIFDEESPQPEEKKPEKKPRGKASRKTKR